MKPDVNKLKQALTQYEEETYRLRRVIRDIEETPKVKACVGKYYKYLNAYGSVSKHSWWWMYYHVKSLKSDTLITDKFHHEDEYGKIEIIFDIAEYRMSFIHPSYVEITKEEYEKAYKNLLKKLTKQFEKNK